MSDTRVGAGLRVARGAITAAVAVGLGLTSHVAAGGLLPSAGWLVFIVAGAGAGSVASMSKPAGLIRMVALVGGGQFATHLMLTVLAGHGGDHHSSSAPVVRAPYAIAELGSDRRGSLRGLTEVRLPLKDGEEFVMPHWATHVLDDLTGPHAAMAVAHMAAAAVVAWWLAQGERALWTVVALLGTSVVQALLRLVSVCDVGSLCSRLLTIRAVHARRRCRLLALQTGGPGRRGPPPLTI